MISLKINGTQHNLEIDPDMPLLWAIRDVLELTGTKYGCGKALCGACTVHMDGEAIRSCIIPVSAVSGSEVTTIEGNNSKVAKEVSKTWEELQVPQCGYCQPGQIMAATALLTENTNPDDEDINDALEGNICRCGTYLRIRAAIKETAGRLNTGENKND